MLRFTIRDAVWLVITVVASLSVAGWSFRQGAERGRISNDVELIEAKYHLELARACLKKHGLPFRRDE
jgi:hypothetical protein